MEDKMKIVDESGDRKYFSQLPHYILNHSTAIDQALYWQMKRYAGEQGVCYATQETLMKKMGVGKHSFRKSLKYLISRGWVEYAGTIKGKTHPVKTYKIKDIWKINILEYEEIGAKSAVSLKDRGQIGSKIGARLAVEEESVKEEIHTAKDSEELLPGWDFKEYLKGMEQNKQRPLQLIAKYFKKRGVAFETKKQAEVAIRRHLRAANQLKEFSNKQIKWAVDSVEEKYPNIAWTLETLVKELTK